MSNQYSAHRRYPRIAAHHSVLVKRADGEGLEEFGRTRTIAAGGCSVIADEPFGLGSALDLLITVDGRVVKARGRVVYEIDADAARKEIGVEFVGLDDPDTIERLLTKSE